VQVLADPGESPPAELRAEWLREVHAAERNVTVIRSDEGHPRVDAVFSSAAWGDELARRLGARHCPVDVERTLVPVASTALRRDPAAHWDSLAAPVRAHAARRIVIVGAESTGKTTLARELRDALAARGGAFAETRWVPEYGRDYTLEKLALARAQAAWRGEALPGMAELEWPTSDFVAIAREQNALERSAARIGGPALVCDTDALATGIWHERYRSVRSGEVEALGDPPASLYLVTHPDDVPFEADEIRDGEHMRAWMTDRFWERLRGTAHRAELVRGARAVRLERALACIDAWLPGALAQVFVDASPTSR
jgi:HTH-type transcriptional regulator, transcriptional repressor of NAD biosynthesis genes